jgi:hypothetical protein
MKNREGNIVVPLWAQYVILPQVGYHNYCALFPAQIQRWPNNAFLEANRVPLHEDVWDSGGIAPHILIVVIGWR